MNNYHYLFKFIIVGESTVGKSCLLLQYTEGRFRVGYDTTIGVEYGSKEFIYDDKLIKLQLWDTAGQESFRSITRAYYRGSIGCFLVYDISRRITFDRIQTWVKDVQQDTNNQIEYFLVGNKCDLKDRKVSYDEGRQLSIQLGCEFQETSAKTGENVEFIFETLTKKIYENIKSNKIDPLDPNHGIKIGKIRENERVTEIPNQKKRSVCC
ncbi:unnamed protein product (macronuclear) [Paramecium tetraurelia]|uniref:Chromosome undetermined scaffold_119, whole genome shotgun sequence n=1 Tax=Paramecium tetraurelia TaxID=5888 RepID=Q3SD43_PARTE|nr:uncharacterized protein GSPATT00030913001 [Paramecium tetraurelia]CAI44522.1 rab_B56 [Paramecium tetraurelia]CAK60274.1 unnamed protein product [Paramecium tetraurelia]|eukprot:XP_001427672.1 hypothetical protein (macronuclear) [Paramecium tetraurelia strain d4-2]